MRLKKFICRIAKAADILGFGREQLRTIECDQRMRMNVGALRHGIEMDL